MDAPDYLLFMTKQGYLAFCAALCFVGVLPVLYCAIVGMRRGYRRISSRWMAVFVLLSSGLAFMAGALTAAGGAKPMTDVIVNFLATTPVVLTIAYVCRMQTRTYPGVRDRRRLRRFFLTVYPTFLTVLTISTLLQLRFPVHLPSLWSEISVVSFFLLSPILLAWCFYSIPAAYVFFEALLSRLTGAAHQIQNFAASVLMTCLSLDGLIWSANFGIRAFVDSPARKQTVLLFQNITNTTYIVEIIAVFAALIAYASRSELSKVSEKLLNYFQRTRRIDGYLQNAPVHRDPYSVPYDCLRKATQVNDLGLSDLERHKALDLYRMAVIMAEDGLREESGRRRISYRDFVDLVILHQQDLADDDIREHSALGHQDEVYSLYEVYASLRQLLSLNAPSPRNFDRWVQLSYLAMKDAGLLHVPDGRAPDVLPKVQRHYFFVEESVWHDALSW